MDYTHVRVPDKNYKPGLVGYIGYTIACVILFAGFIIAIFFPVVGGGMLLGGILVGFLTIIVDARIS